MPRYISPDELKPLVGSSLCPLVIDVRRRAVFETAPTRIAGSIWRDHMRVAEWLPELPRGHFVIYCAHGHNVSEIAAAALHDGGREVSVLEGGIEAFEVAGGSTVAASAPQVEAGGPATQWVTRQRPKIDRIACPWLIRRFIDPLATFHFVAAEWVRDVADETGWIPFDVEGVALSHRGERCSFDTLMDDFGVADRDLARLARIVRGADTARLDLEPEAAGLLAISLGLSASEADDHEQLEKGMVLYDALFGWCRHASGEQHNWPAKAA